MADYRSTWPLGLHGKVLELFRSMLPLRMHRGITEGAVAAARAIVDSALVREEEQRTGLPRETVGYSILLALLERVEDPNAKLALRRAWNPDKTLAPKLTDRRIGDAKTATTLENHAIADVARKFARLRHTAPDLGDYLAVLGHSDPSSVDVQSHSQFDQWVTAKFDTSETYETATARITVKLRSNIGQLRSVLLPTEDYLHAICPSEEAKQLRLRLEGERRGVRFEPILRRITLERPLEPGEETDIELGPRTVSLPRGDGQAVGMVYLPGWRSLTVEIESPLLWAWPAEYIAAIETEEVKHAYRRGLVAEEDDWFSRWPAERVSVPEGSWWGPSVGWEFQPQPAGTKCVVGWFRPPPRVPRQG